MNEKRTATLLDSAEGHWLAWLGHPVRYMATGGDTDGRYALSWGSVPVGSGPPPHRHDFEEGFYVVKGELTFTAGNQSVVLTAGGFINIGSGTGHYLKNTGTEEAEVIVIVGPAGFDQFQMDGGAAIKGPSDITELTPKTRIDYLKKIGPKYNIDLDPPPEAFTSEPNITVRKASEGTQIAAVGDLYRFLATADDTNGKYAIWEATSFPGGGPPPHVHFNEEEGFYLLEGELTFFVGGEQHVAQAGAFANLPIGVEHTFKNEADVPVKMLILVAPGGLEKMFERTGKVLTDPNVPVAPPSHEEIERLLRIAPEYGIEISAPKDGH